MKLSISLSTDDVDALDRYVREAGLPSRSAAVQRAIRQLRDAALEDDYAAAWEEWSASGEQALWDTVVGDGLADAPR